MTDRAAALRVYLDPAEIGDDGYPHVWHLATGVPPERIRLPIKDQVREQAGHRCQRCGHPYGRNERGEWTPCDDQCVHDGPIRYRFAGQRNWIEEEDPAAGWRQALNGAAVEAQWRILTVHHLNGVKHDCRWWNLAALCQRCHLSVQARVVMDRLFLGEHTDWFKPHAAGYYAWRYLGLELGRAETLDRLDELLELEHRQLTLAAPSEAGDPDERRRPPWSPPAA